MRKYIAYRVLAIFLILLNGVISCDDPEPEFTGAISGIITNEKSVNAGDPVSNVRVTLDGPSSDSYTTGTDGRYQFRDAKIGVYSISFNHPDYQNAESQPFTVGENQVLKVDFTLSPIDAIGVSPAALNYGEEVNELTVTVQNVISTEISYEIDIANSWISLNKTKGTLSSGNSASIAVTIDRKALELGSNEGAFTINVPNRSSYTVNVYVTYDPQIPLEINPTNLDFNTAVNKLELSVKNISNEPVNYEVQVPGDWLTLSKTKGVITGNNTDLLNVSVNRDRLNVGSHDGTIIFNVPDQGSKAIQVLVTKLDASAAVFVLDEGVLDFGKSLDQRILKITNEGDNTLIWNLNVTDNWLSASDASGSLPPNNQQSLTVYVNRNGLSDGDFNGKLSFTSNGGNAEVSIKMEVDNTNTGGGGETVVTAGLRAYYTFDDGTVKDEMDNFAAVPIGVTSSEDSPVTGGKSMEFDGVDDFVQISGNPLFNSNRYIIHGSLTMWVKTSVDGTLIAIPLSYDDTENEFISGFKGGKIRHSLFNRDGRGGCCADYIWGEFEIEISALILNNEWNHIVLSYDGSDSSVSLYLNGVLVSKEKYEMQGTLDAPLSRIGADYYSGSNDYGLPNFQGLLDNIRIYNRPLSSSEVKEIFNAKQ
ncbi:MAG: LamG-like jellyroll fold domain-containing protein [Cyclobacteriaceae bacterium]